MHPTQTKQQARQLFFQTDLTRAQIAQITGISHRTLFDWIKEGDWLRARANAASAPALIAEAYYAQLTELNKKIARRRTEAYPTLEESTIIRRLAGTIKAVKPTRNRNEAVELMAEFSRFVRKHNAAAADVLTDIMTAFLETIHTPLPEHEDEEQRIKDYARYLEQVQQEEKERLDSEAHLPKRQAWEARLLREDQESIDRIEEAEMKQILATVKKEQEVETVPAEDEQQEMVTEQEQEIEAVVEEETETETERERREPEPWTTHHNAALQDAAKLLGNYRHLVVDQQQWRNHVRESHSAGGGSV